jgi:hypothetical protein
MALESVLLVILPPLKIRRDSAKQVLMPANG